MNRLLQGDALAYFNCSAITHIGDLAENFTLCVNELIVHVLPQHALAEQKCYLRCFICKPQDLIA